MNQDPSRQLVHRPQQPWGEQQLLARFRLAVLGHLTFVVGNDLREVATFVSERLASVEGVLSTATHFMLRAYKEQGHLLLSPLDGEDKPAVSP